jgi:hypothetical protein
MNYNDENGIFSQNGLLKNQKREENADDLNVCLTNVILM